MEWTLLITIALSGLIYYLFNEFEDESIKSNWKKNKQFFNTNISWKNKWKLDSGGNLQPTIKWWYYFGIYPKYRERFIYSSTIFVFLTDGEHLFQFIKNLALLGGFLYINWMYGLVWWVGKSVGSFIKEIFFKNIQ